MGVESMGQSNIYIDELWDFEIACDICEISEVITTSSEAPGGATAEAERYANEIGLRPYRDPDDGFTRHCCWHCLHSPDVSTGELDWLDADGDGARGTLADWVGINDVAMLLE